MLETERLWLRRWRPEDRAPFAALNADPEVMAHFPSVLTRGESDAMVDRIEAHFEATGFGPWAVQPKAGGEMLGYVGLFRTPFEAHFTPCVEAAWRLSRAAWGQGYATEAARAAIADGFERVGLPGVVSFTSVGNLRSRRVMERLGFGHDPGDDFEHPRLEPGSPLRRHVLYRLERASWYGRRP